MLIYICGDSFCTSDPAYGTSWVDKFTASVPEHRVVNLAVPGASNYLIYLQVKEALSKNCDYLIYHATSSIRYEFKIADSMVDVDHAYRYNLLNNVDPTMVCGSWYYLAKHHNQFISADQQNTISKFFSEFVDINNLIEKNKIFIEHTLSKINSSTVKGWAWSQGGFEHPSFAGSSSQEYFTDYKYKEVDINLWDYYDKKRMRPYFHVDDPAIVQKVYSQTKEMLKLHI